MSKLLQSDQPTKVEGVPVYKSVWLRYPFDRNHFFSQPHHPTEYSEGIVIILIEHHKGQIPRAGRYWLGLWSYFTKFRNWDIMATSIIVPKKFD